MGVEKDRKENKGIRIVKLAVTSKWTDQTE